MVAYASRVNRLIPIVIVAWLLGGCAPERDVPRLHERLPDSPAFTRLVFRAYVDEFTVSVDGRRIYAFRDPQSSGRLTVHVVTLPPHSAGKCVVFEVPHPPRQDVLIGNARYLATEATLPFAIERATAHELRDDADDLVLGFVLIVVGAIAGISSLVRRRGDTLALGSFGVFTLLYGLRLLVDSSLPFVFGVSWRTTAFAEAFITYVIPIAGWALPLRLIGDGWRSTLRLQVIAFMLFAPIGIISDLVTGTPSSLELVNNVLVIIGGVNILFNLLRADRRSLELRVVLAGSLVFMAFALNNNLTSLGVLPWRYHAEAPGFVLFVAALGFAATRGFVRGERESMELENELRTAREIQQSILPRAMPDASGLRFDAAYVPATSVGGDMYSFLERDGGAGVLVADVAGHGVPAALIASMVKIAVSSQARLADDPAALIGELNAILRRDVRRAFVTATYLWVAERRVVVCNAGHPPPLLLRDGAFMELGGAGVLLGRFADARYTAVATPIVVGDRIVAYTDGIPEARNARDELFGEERLRELVREGASAESVLAAVLEWRGDATAEADDLTIVMIDVVEPRS
jgi:sigma-B regulation protein RsbU (phosphoserine phosphatase)